MGTGFGVITHLRALRAAGFEVHALVGRNEDKAAARARMFDVAYSSNSLAGALALPGVDVVAIATPPHTHAPIALEAIAAGKHVVCEKPFAANAAEARMMSTAAERAGVVHLLGTEFRFATGQAHLTRAVAQGVIGTPRFAVFMLQIPSLADPLAEIPSWWEKASEGGGWLGAYGSHVVDQIRVTLGEFEGVSASVQTLSPRAMTADDTYTVHFRLTTGVDGIMHSSCAIGGQFLATTKITGTAGSVWLQGDDVWVDAGAGPRQLDTPDDLRNSAPVPPPPELLHTTYDMWHSTGLDLSPYTHLYAVLRDRILGNAVASDPAAATFADGVAGQAVLDAIRRSSREQAWVTVEQD
ncbi:MAG TPA: Gfo/Idh/MocA family oxidoreductase [Acidimicrobiales bacterium]|nr:Gfo/Idh/MocA family oxidoreductase [Acidimicrobiales bacterium]